MSFQTLEALTVRARVARVNLLPADFAVARRTRRTRLVLGAGVLVVAGLCAGAAVISGQHVSDAQSALSAEQGRTAPLQAAQRPYAEVPKVLAELNSAQQVKKAVDQYDVAWYSYLDRFSTSAPTGVVMTSLAFKVTTGSESTPAENTNPLAVAGIGTVTVAGQSTSQDLIGTWMDNLTTVDGVTEPTLASSNKDATTGVVSFNAGATLTAAALQSSRQ